MCNLTDKYVFGESKTVYKAVAKRGENYYSLAMGCKYPICGTVPVVKKQNAISNSFTTIMPYKSRFNPGTLVTPAAFEEEMTGRTSGFFDKEVCIDSLSHHSYYLRKGYKLCFIKVKLSKELMIGEYVHNQVLAGRHMKILGEIKP